MDPAVTRSRSTMPRKPGTGALRLTGWAILANSSAATRLSSGRATRSTKLKVNSTPLGSWTMSASWRVERLVSSIFSQSSARCSARSTTDSTSLALSGRVVAASLPVVGADGDVVSAAPVAVPAALSPVVLSAVLSAVLPAGLAESRLFSRSASMILSYLLLSAPHSVLSLSWAVHGRSTCLQFRQRRGGGGRERCS